MCVYVCVCTSEKTGEVEYLANRKHSDVLHLHTNPKNNKAVRMKHQHITIIIIIISDEDEMQG